jgi:ATP-dependent Lhr-like helicase
MIAEDILFESAGRYSLGARGEKLYGWRNFSELYAVFSTPQTLRVMFGAQEIGSIDALFAQGEPLDTFSFTLGAKAWRAVEVNWKESIVRVEPIASAALARWQGPPQLLGWDLCQAIRDVLSSDTLDAEWSQRARVKLAELRAAHDLLADDGHVLVADGHGLRLWTFAGGRANNLLGRVLEAKLGPKVVIDNQYIAFREQAGLSDAAIRKALAEVREEQRPNHDDALRFAESCARGRTSKFQPCLSGRLESEFLAEVLTNEDEARKALSGHE